MAALPLYGFQLALVLLICVPLRLDAAIAYVAAHLSNPITLPVFLALEIEIGALLLEGRLAGLSTESITKAGVATYAKHLLLGAPILGISLALLGALLTFSLTRRQRPGPTARLAAAIERTRQRYASASFANRAYVDNKLLNDSALEILTREEPDLGVVVDAGCGFGQVGLCLLDGGFATGLYGFDQDIQRIAEARRAGGAEATFCVEQLGGDGWPPADTVLFLDSLHYADAATQDRALRAAARALRPGGRLFLREPRARAGWRSRLTQLFERFAIRWRGQPRAVFRSAHAYARILEESGLDCQFLAIEDWGPFDNFALRAVKRR